MHLLPKEIEVALEEGFAPSKDIFKRSEFGDRLTKLVRALEDPTVLMIDSPWGTGKTTFVKMWRGSLSKAGVPNFYFDAFANDYHEDAFLALAGEIIAESERALGTKKAALKNFTAKAIGVAKVLGRTALHVGLKTSTAGLIDSALIAEGIENSLSEVAKDTGGEAAKIVDEILKERLESHSKDRRTFEAFNQALKDLVQELAKNKSPETDESGETPTTTPVAFIIDELDRCKPTFALELLERVKHFFSVPGVVFVLVTNLPQLEAATRAVYGAIEARAYLEKFYHLRFTLPVVIDPHRPGINAASTYLRYLFAKIRPQNEDRELIDSMIELTSHLAEVHSLSLRTLERVCAYSAIFLVSTEARFLRPGVIIAGLCVMKVISPDLYAKLSTGNSNYAEVSSFLRFEQWTEIHDKTSRASASEFAEDWWRYVLGSLDDEKIQMFRRTLFQYNFRKPSDILDWCCRFVDGIAFPG